MHQKQIIVYYDKIIQLNNSLKISVISNQTKRKLFIIKNNINICYKLENIQDVTILQN
jgi:hypothetical protein